MHCFLWNPKVHYNVPLVLPVVPILKKISPVHTLPTYLKALNTIHQSIHIMKKYHPIFILVKDVLFYTVLCIS